MLNHESNESKLGELDMAIVKAIESTGEYKLYGWEVPDFCRLTLIFERTDGSRMGMDLSIYPVSEEEEDDN